MSIAKKNLPSDFRLFFWSYDFRRLDILEDKKLIILQLINYGTLKHWQWLVETYGLKEIKRVIKQVSAGEIKPRTCRLISVLFAMPEKEFNYAPRSLKRQG